MKNKQPETEAEYYNEINELSQKLVFSIAEQNESATKEYQRKLETLFPAIAEKFGVVLSFSPDKEQSELPPGEIHYRQWLKKMGNRNKQ
ncbi:hypothetical protein KKC32_04470 [Patescibacteria group bacterium]|nr:hypothetical protein [Patescibacteria group bacterium]